MKYLLDIDVLMGGFALGCLVILLGIILGVDKKIYAKLFKGKWVVFKVVGVYVFSYLLSLGLNSSLGEMEASPQRYLDYSTYKSDILLNRDADFVEKHDVLNKIKAFEQDKIILNYEVGQAAWFYTKIHKELSDKKRAEDNKHLLAKRKEIKEGLGGNGAQE